MDSISLDIAAVHIVRIDPAEDVLVGIRTFLADKGIRQAIVTGGYGTLAEHHLHWVKHNRLPAENLYGRGQGGIEILAMNGLAVDGEPHVHITLSTPEGAYGGHLEDGCIAYVLCEVFLLEVRGAILRRDWVEMEIPGMGKGPVPRLSAEG